MKYDQRYLTNLKADSCIYYTCKTIAKLTNIKTKKQNLNKTVLYNQNGPNQKGCKTLTK